MYRSFGPEMTALRPSAYAARATRLYGRFACPQVGCLWLLPLPSRLLASKGNEPPGMGGREPLGKVGRDRPGMGGGLVPDAEPPAIAVTPKSNAMDVNTAPGWCRRAPTLRMCTREFFISCAPCLSNCLSKRVPRWTGTMRRQNVSTRAETNWQRRGATHRFFCEAWLLPAERGRSGMCNASCCLRRPCAVVKLLSVNAVSRVPRHVAHIGRVA